MKWRWISLFWISPIQRAHQHRLFFDLQDIIYLLPLRSDTRSPLQTSNIENFAIIVKSKKPLTIVDKLSILHAFRDPYHASAFTQLAIAISHRRLYSLLIYNLHLYIVSYSLHITYILLYVAVTLIFFELREPQLKIFSMQSNSNLGWIP